MTIKLYQETTAWSDDTPNHTYLIDNEVSREKILGYIKSDEDLDGNFYVIWFDTPIRFYKGGRKFKIVDFDNNYQWNWQ